MSHKLLFLPQPTQRLYVDGSGSLVLADEKATRPGDTGAHLNPLPTQLLGAQDEHGRFVFMVPVEGGSCYASVSFELAEFLAQHLGIPMSIRVNGTSVPLNEAARASAAPQRKYLLIHHRQNGETSYLVESAVRDEQQLIARFVQSGALEHPFNLAAERITCHAIPDEPANHVD